MFVIGSHLSISKGYLNMGKEATKIGGNTFQYFTRNPRGGSMRALDVEDMNSLSAYMKEHNFGTLLAHAPYTYNPCAAKEDLRAFAKQAMTEDLERMEYLPGQMYNFHPGSHVGQGAEEGIRLISEMLNASLSRDMTTTVLLETMAGKGSEVGRSFEELKEILDRTELSEKLGVCLDTCHVWDAGYDIVGDLDGILTEFDKVIGLNRLKAIHLNDSLNDRGSHKDRHARIGEGHIGWEAFTRIINHPALRDLPFILETPNDDAGWTDEIARLRAARI